MMRFHRFAMMLCAIAVTGLARAGSFAPQVGQSGAAAIGKDSPLFEGWATGFTELVRGPLDIANPAGPLASFGSGDDALGAADGGVVSLGDGGRITLTFDRPITDGPGADFAVFENGFLVGGAGLAYLELAFVEVSSNGEDFVRFPSISETQTTAQVGGFGLLDASNLHNLAGKYVSGYGTPFDLAGLSGASPLLDIGAVRFVRLIDVVGSIDPALGRRDSQGNLMNDPYPSPFASGGFDLDALGVLHVVPEPSSLVLGVLGLAIGGGAAIVRRARSA